MKLVAGMAALFFFALVSGESGDERLEYTGLEAQEHVNNRDFTCAEYVKVLLEQANENDDLNNYIGLDYTDAFFRALDTDVLIKEGGAGELSCIPFVVDDNIHTSLFPCTAGTPAFADNVPDFVGSVLTALEASGGFLLGTTNMHELAFGVTNFNANTGACRNPFDKDMFSGGASGGSAVTVAARMAPIALGTDTGGSTRISAALNGLFGFRPTVGRYGQDGVVPISSYRDTIGLIGRSVEDMQLFDKVITGDDFVPENLTLGQIRLGYDYAEFFDDSVIDSDYHLALRRALNILEDSDVELVPLGLDSLFEKQEKCATNLVFYEFPLNMTTYLESTPNGYTSDDLVDHIATDEVARIVGGLFSGDIERLTESEYNSLLGNDCAAFKSYWRDLISDLDGIIFPTTILPARPINSTSENEFVRFNGEWVPAFPTYIRNTDIAGTGQHPGISIPATFNPDGLSLGLEIDGAIGSDRHLLEVARLVGELFGGSKRPSDITYYSLSSASASIVALPALMVGLLVAL
eukprot:CAMPEP_0119143512 /NCGR_PEP_ID=MMETSP1310-20130426/34448_1 /TAXON_ID=464262 /ORGANISM="Genus nov. species nov., Strain RCC2339" /LENGTH=521 /DNA_ID=CAMNT_0007135149 /DNA_START=99 /DNA_END=1664 /DNA_ORIENTATION=+